MIRLEIEIDPLKRLSLQDFSYSRLSTYLDCKLKYFYSYILKEPQDFGHAALLGNIIHQALEVTIEHEQEISLSELLYNYKASRKELDPGSKIPDEMIASGEDMLREFVDVNAGPQTVYDKELAFSFVLGRARFNGFIDYVDVQGDKVVVRDYKSGAREVAQKNVSTDLQLGIYSLYMKHLFPDKEIYAELYYLKSGKQKGHHFTSDDLLSIENRLIELSEELLNTEYFPPTSDNSKCYWCSYSKNGVCAIGKQRTRR